MSNYVKRITVPSLTPENNPVAETIHPREKQVAKVEILFPTNAAGLVGIRLKDRSRIFAPAGGEGDEWYFGDGPPPVTLEPRYHLTGGPFELTVEGHNDDDTFDRTVEVRFEIVDFTLEDMMLRLARGEELRGRMGRGESQ